MRKSLMPIGVVVVLGLIVGVILIIFPSGPTFRSHPGEETATMMSLDTDLYFSLNLSPGYGQPPKLFALLRTVAGNRDAGRTWRDWKDKLSRETGIDVEKEVFPWLRPEIAVGLQELTGPEPQFVLMIGTKNARASAETLDEWWEYLQDRERMELESTSYRNVAITTAGRDWGEPQHYALTEGYLLSSSVEE